MNIQLILIIVGLVLVFFLAFKLLKGLLKAFVTVLVIALILMVVSGIIIYNDAMTIKQGFEEQKTVVITNNDELVIAFKASADVSLSSAINQDFYESFSEEELRNISEKIANEEYNEIEKENFLIVINQRAFYGKQAEFLELDLNFTQEVLNEFALSKTSQEAVFILEKLDGLDDASAFEGVDVDELKSYVYYSLFKSRIKDTKGGFIISEVKNKNINTRPELLSVKVLNFFPKSIMERLTRGD